MRWFFALLALIATAVPAQELVIGSGVWGGAGVGVSFFPGAVSIPSTPMRLCQT